MKFVASFGFPVVMLVAAGFLYFHTDRNESLREHLRDSAAVARQILLQDGALDREAARVAGDPFADFDSLTASISELRRLKDELADTTRRMLVIPGALAHGISSYIGVIEDKEERIERFRASYAALWQSVRHLPLAAASLVRLAEDADEPGLAAGVPRLSQDVDAYLNLPTATEQKRLATEVAALRAESERYPPPLAEALAVFANHADVLVARKTATDQVFEEVTNADIAQRTERLVANMEFAADRAGERARRFEVAMFGSLAALILFWGAAAIVRFVDPRAARRHPPQGAAPGAPEAGQPRASAARRQQDASPAALPPSDRPALPGPSHGRRPDGAGARPGPAPSPPAPSLRGAPERPRPVGLPAAADPAPAPSVQPPPDAKALSRIVTGFVASSLTGHTGQLLTRLDHLQQAQDRLRQAVETKAGNAVATDLDVGEDIDTSFAVLSSLRRQLDNLTALAGRLEAFATERDAEGSYEFVNVERCVDQACRAVRADAYATVSRNVSEVPDLYVSRFELLLLLEYILENAVRSVRELNGRKGMIKIDVARRNAEVRITVVDNGDGFEADQKSKIFEPFYTTRKDALGIGLPSAAFLAGKYRGTVSANSLPGEGTVFRVTLPAGISSARAA